MRGPISVHWLHCNCLEFRQTLDAIELLSLPFPQHHVLSPSYGVNLHSYSRGQNLQKYSLFLGR